MKQKSIKKEINDIMKKLELKAKKYGLYENFGNSEVLSLKDKYFSEMYANNNIWNEIENFEKWCMNYSL
ncbi:MAG: hypothetical protein J6T10_32300 [Methanobrevibacter sp.]|nr:hypothetical protein [Methanobrevibacter sp.]